MKEDSTALIIESLRDLRIRVGKTGEDVQEIKLVAQQQGIILERLSGIEEKQSDLEKKVDEAYKIVLLFNKIKKGFVRFIIILVTAVVGVVVSKFR